MMLEAFETAQIRPRLWQPLRDGTSRRRIALPAARNEMRVWATDDVFTALTSEAREAAGRCRE